MDRVMWTGERHGPCARNHGGQLEQQAPPPGARRRAATPSWPQCGIKPAMHPTTHLLVRLKHMLLDHHRHTAAQDRLMQPHACTASAAAASLDK